MSNKKTRWFLVSYNWSDPITRQNGNGCLTFYNDIGKMFSLDWLQAEVNMGNVIPVLIHEFKTQQDYEDFIEKEKRIDTGK